ncbi:U-actitoxin-Avd3o-like [Cochliomyia hominivorax]
MNFLHIFALFLVTLIAYTSAQGCRGAPANPSCAGGRNVGRRGRRCRASSVWYYNTRNRRCERIRYLGCRGNNNRWCSQAACHQGCRRPPVLT